MPKRQSSRVAFNIPPGQDGDPLARGDGNPILLAALATLVAAAGLTVFLMHAGQLPPFNHGALHLGPAAIVLGALIGAQLLFRASNRARQQAGSRTEPPKWIKWSRTVAVVLLVGFLLSLGAHAGGCDQPGSKCGSGSGGGGDVISVHTHI